MYWLQLCANDWKVGSSNLRIAKLPLLVPRASSLTFNCSVVPCLNLYFDMAVDGGMAGWMEWIGWIGWVGHLCDHFCQLTEEKRF